MNKIQFAALVLFRFLKRYVKKTFFAQNHDKKWKLSAALFILFFLVFLGSRINSARQQKHDLLEGVVGAYTQNNLPSLITNLISNSLVVLDQSGKPQPELASGWKVENDAKMYTFKLKNGLFWSDGTMLKSSDIKINIPDVEVSYPDEKTIQFKLADSFNLFPTLLTTPVFKNNSLVGIGKYKVTSMDFSHGMITKLSLTPDAENLPRLFVRFYPEEKIARTAFEVGEIESIFGLSETDSLAKQPGIGIKNIKNFNKIVAVFYNTKDQVLSDKNMRKALNSAAPKIGGEERAKTSIPAFSWAFNNEVRDALGDTSLSKTYLEKVSFGKESKIVLTSTPYLAQLGEKIIESWKKVGINAVLRVESGIPQNFQALLIPQSIPPGPDQYLLWHSTQTKTNLSKYSSPRVDKDLEDGRKMGDIETRKARYMDFQKVLADDLPATFLYFPKTQVVYRKKAENNLNKILGLQIPQATY